MKTLKFLLIAVLISFVLYSFEKYDQEKWDIPEKYVTMKNPTYANKENLLIGKALYSKHCKSCHGTKGKGDGTKADTIDTEMGDFTDGSISDQSDGALYYKTFTGRDDMPGFKKKISDEKEQWLVINYLRKLTN